MGGLFFSKIHAKGFLIMVALFKKIITNCKAATAIEYSLMAAGIAMAIIVMVFLLGDRVESSFQAVDDEIATQMPTP